MLSSVILKDICIEKIGILGENSLKSSLEGAFQGLPYTFESHQESKNLLTWIQDHRPRLVLLDASHLQAMEEPHRLELHELLTNRGVLTLILTIGTDEIHQWRPHWPQAHFHPGPFESDHLKQKVVNILLERLLMERPCAAIFSENNTILTHIELLLKNYGFRIQAQEGNASGGTLSTERPQLYIWDVPLWKEYGKDFYEQLRMNEEAASIPILVISETWPAPKSLEIPESMKGVTLISADVLNQSISRLSEEIFKARLQNIQICRDQHTGLLLPAFFFQLCERELHYGARYGEGFSILKLSLKGLEEAEAHWGKAFIQELASNIGLFIQNRVRSTDLISQGSDGEVWVLLSRVGKDEAQMVADRLQKNFQEILSKVDTSSAKVPQLANTIYSYPAQIQSVQDLQGLITLSAV